MSVLVIGADEITPIKAVLKNLGAERAQRKPRKSQTYPARYRVRRDAN